jgi:formylglycine-generating enzyme required for sulfatase activity
MNHFVKTIFLIVGILFFPLEFFAVPIYVDGIYYEFSENEAIVTKRHYLNDPDYSGYIVIPEKITYLDKTYTIVAIGNDAFSGTSITGVVIPPSVTYIGYSAFWNCDRLSNVIIPISVTSIGQDAFGACDNLTSIVIPSLVADIGARAFIGSSLMDIYSYPISPLICNTYYDTFNDYTGSLHVPAASLAAYFTSPVWCNFENIIGDAIEPSSITINQDSLNFHIGDQFNLTASVLPPNTTTNKVIWISTNKFVATVENGEVTATGLGECDIIAYCCYGYKAVCHVSVVEQSYIISLYQHEAMVLPNHILNLTPTATPELPNLAVKSSDPTVAAARVVNGKVQIVGIKEGTTTITVGSTSGTAQSDSCFVTVYTEMGDVNADGYVDVSDVTTLISLVLGNDVTAFNAPKADVNQDDILDVSDVTALISFILSGSWPAKTFTVNGVSFKMVPVEGGTFMMGATAEQGDEPRDEEKPAHQVTLSSFSIAQTEVTQALWLAVMGSNPSHFSPAYGYDENLNRPVERVTWNACQVFISRLNELTGMTFRLPTEAEWEFAARGGNKSKGYKYSGSDDVNEVAWHMESSTSMSPQPVATKAPNELNLYDMSGNVWEWCQDWYGSYESGPQVNPTGPTSGSCHIIRGGAWNDGVWACRVSFRSWFEPSYTDYMFGLRLAI